MRPFSRRSLVPVPGGATEVLAGEGIAAVEVESGSQTDVRLSLLPPGRESWAGESSIELADGARIPCGQVERLWVLWPAGASIATPLELTLWHVEVTREPGGAGASGGATEVTLAALLAAFTAEDFSTETTLASLFSAFSSTDFATQTTLAALLAAFAATDFSTETTLASLLAAFAAEDFATQTTLAALLAAFAGTDFATQTTLAALNAKVTACNTGAVVVSSSALPTGAATAAKQLADGHNVAIPAVGAATTLTNVSTTYNNTTTTATSAAVDCSEARRACISLDLSKANAPTDIQLIVEVSPDGSNWAPLMNGPLGLWIYDDTAVGSGISRALEFPVAASELRLRVVATGTTASATFTIANAKVWLRD